MLIRESEINADKVIKQGVIVSEAYYRPVNVQEIIRCTVLAIRRRAKLMGPACRHDPQRPDRGALDGHAARGRRRIARVLRGGRAQGRSQGRHHDHEEGRQGAKTHAQAPSRSPFGF